MKKKLAALAVLCVAGLSTAYLAFGAGETTGTVTAVVPGQTITIPGTTNVETYTVPTVTETVTVTNGTTPAPQPYYFEHFDGSFNTGIMRSEGGNSANPGFSFSNGGGRVFDCAASKPGTCVDGTASGSSSSYGQLSFVGTDGGNLHAGFDPVTGNGKHEETWARFQLMFPSGAYQAVPRQQNVVWEMHLDATTPTTTNNPYVGSNMLKIASDDNGTFSTTCAGTPYFCTKPGLNPRLALQLCGGNLATLPSTSQACATYQMPLNSLKLDHWYDVVVDLNYNDDPTVGGATVWLDGTKVFDVRASTQYRRPNGTLSYASVGGFYNYRYWANFPSSINFDEWEWGPTAASVGFNG